MFRPILHSRYNSVNMTITLDTTAYKLPNSGLENDGQKF